MDYIRQKVERIVNENMTNNPFDLAQSLGLSVYFSPFSKIKGMIISAFGRKIIIVNSLLSEEMQRFVLAHELGHHELSPSGSGYFFIAENSLMESKIEYEANRFAVELLAGDEEPEEGETVEQFANRLCIPSEMIRLIR